MKKLNRVFFPLVGIVVFCLFSFACDGTSSMEIEDETFGDVIIPASTTILDEASMASLNTVSEDQSVLTFSGENPTLSSISEGQVIVSGVSPHTPQGLLRKVVQVEREGSSTTLITAPATLEEAIKQGELEVRRVLRAEDAVEQRAVAEGVSFAQNGRKNQVEFFIELKDVVLADNDGNRNTTSDQIVANGSFSFTPTIDFAIKINSPFQLEYIRFGIETEIDFEGEIEARIPLTLTEAFPIASYTLAPIVVVFPPSPFPVVIIPIVTLFLGVEGTVSIGLSTGFDAEVMMEGKIEWSKTNGLTPFHDFSADADFIPVHASARADARLYSTLPLDLLVYGVVGPRSAAHTYLEAKVETDRDPWWELYWGIGLDAGIRAEIFGRTLIDAEFPNLIGARFSLANAGGPFNPVSPPVISNLRATLQERNGCTFSDGSIGHLYRYSLDYSDTDGDVLSGTVLNGSYRFLPNGSAGTFTAANLDITGNGFQGTISFERCIKFGNQDAIERTVSITDLGGNTSNSIQNVVSRPEENGPFISNLTTRLVDLNACTLDTGETGSVFESTFSYTDVDSDVTAGSEVMVSWVFSPSGSMGSFTVQSPEIVGSPSQGEITFYDCYYYASDDDVTRTVTLIDASGAVSNALVNVISRPPGAEKQGGGAGAASSVLANHHQVSSFVRTKGHTVGRDEGIK